MKAYIESAILRLVFRDKRMRTRQIIDLHEKQNYKSIIYIFKNLQTRRDSEIDECFDRYREQVSIVESIYKAHRDLSKKDILVLYANLKQTFYYTYSGYNIAGLGNMLKESRNLTKTVQTYINGLEYYEEDSCLPILNDILGVAKGELPENIFKEIDDELKVRKLEQIRREKLSNACNVLGYDIPSYNITRRDIKNENEIVEIVKKGGDDLAYLLLALVESGKNKDLMQSFTKGNTGYSEVPKLTTSLDFSWDK